MKPFRSFLMVTTITVVGLTAGSALAQPAPPAPPAEAAPPAPAAEPAPPAPPAAVDPRISFRPGDVVVRRLMLGEMALGDRFAAIDTDGDGKITAGEFQEAANAFFAELDTNGDGVLDDNDRREPAVVEDGDRGPGPVPVPERGDDRRRTEEFRGGMMFFRGGPIFWGIPGMWFFAVPMGPQGGPDFRGGPNFEFRPGPGPGGPGGGQDFEYRMGPGGHWFYWEGPERHRD